jgi:hypothetical protein
LSGSNGQKKRPLVPWTPTPKQNKKSPPSVQTQGRQRASATYTEAPRKWRATRLATLIALTQINFTKGPPMNNVEIFLSFPEGFPKESAMPVHFDASSGTPAVGDIMKVTPDQRPLRVTKRQWVSTPKETQLHIHLEEVPPQS